MNASAVLAYIPSPPQGVWTIGPVPLRAYAFFIIVGIFAAIWWGERRWVARGGESGFVTDLALWVIPFGLIGGRLYHVATDFSTYFGPQGDPLDVFKVWEGGLGIWGAVAFGGVGAWIGCKRKGVPLPPVADALAPAVLLAQAIGRLGNYFNQELYGRETTLPWGLEIYERVNASGVTDNLNGVAVNTTPDSIVHPTFLYEMLWNLLIVGLLVLVDKKFKIGHGRLFALYVAGYCVGRFGIELLRSDYATEIFGLRVNTYTSAILFVGAVAYFVLAPKGRESADDLDRSNVEGGGTALSALMSHQPREEKSDLSPLGKHAARESVIVEAEPITVVTDAAKHAPHEKPAVALDPEPDTVPTATEQEQAEGSAVAETPAKSPVAKARGMLSRLGRGKK